MSNRQEILLVDDSADDVDLCVRSLSTAGVVNEIVVANDGVEALDYLHGRGRWAGRDPRSLPGLVLLDIKMPRMDGLETLGRIRADPLTRLLPVVMLTSSKEEADVTRSYDCGANSFVQKPVDFHEFAEAVRQLGVYWLLVNVPPATQGAV